MAARKKKPRDACGPQVIEDGEEQLTYQVVAAIDVSKKDGAVCVRRPPLREGGRRVSLLETVAATIPAVTALAGRLLEAGAEIVTMESTSDYWRIWYYLLEAAGLRVQLVDPAQAKNLPGRPKTDMRDAQWLAWLTEHGLLRPCFVPPPPIRELRILTRTRLRLMQDRTRQLNRLEKLLEGALLKLTNVVQLTTVSARAMVWALVRGERDPKVLASMARTRMKVKVAELTQVFTGIRFSAAHASAAESLLTVIDALDARIEVLDCQISAAVDQIPEAAGVTADGEPSPRPGPGAQVLDAVSRLAEIPGISEDLARCIIAETGLDMTRFPSAAHLVSWAGMAPVARQSGPRNRRGKKNHGNAYLRGYLTQAATGAAMTGTFLGERKRRLTAKIGAKRAKVAVGRSILIIVWHLLSDPAARFRDLGPGHYQAKNNRDKLTRRALRTLASLEWDVELTDRKDHAA